MWLFRKSSGGTCRDDQDFLQRNIRSASSQHRKGSGNTLDYTIKNQQSGVLTLYKFVWLDDALLLVSVYII